MTLAMVFFVLAYNIRYGFFGRSLITMTTVFSRGYSIGCVFFPMVACDIGYGFSVVVRL